MRTFAALTVGGVASLLLLKLLAFLMAPLLGFAMTVLGVLMTALKFTLIAGLVYLVYSMFFKRKKSQDVS